MTKYTFKTKRGKHLVYYLDESCDKSKKQFVDVQTDSFYCGKSTSYPMTKELASHIYNNFGIMVYM